MSLHSQQNLRILKVRGVKAGPDPAKRLGRSPPLNLTKVTLFTMTFYNSENNIRDIRPFCRTLSFVTAVLWSMLHLCYCSEAVMSLDSPLTLLAGSTPVWKSRKWGVGMAASIVEKY